VRVVRDKTSGPATKQAGAVEPDGGRAAVRKTAYPADAPCASVSSAVDALSSSVVRTRASSASTVAFRFASCAWMR
jgi:hypothetical protein